MLPFSVRVAIDTTGPDMPSSLPHFPPTTSPRLVDRVAVYFAPEFSHNRGSEAAFSIGEAPLLQSLERFTLQAAHRSTKLNINVCCSHGSFFPLERKTVPANRGGGIVVTSARVVRLHGALRLECALAPSRDRHSGDFAIQSFFRRLSEHHEDNHSEDARHAAKKNGRSFIGSPRQIRKQRPANHGTHPANQVTEKDVANQTDRQTTPGRKGEKEKIINPNKRTNFSQHHVPLQPPSSTRPELQTVEALSRSRSSLGVCRV
ncbi:hypothetical protein IWZ03DRAFT_70208 [Phyllosticta citriasiana]|uniref:Uncharacterized protein n=1 Tax=Phyllosticta citriasiana TaxID=595635 RepID=A0ABR1KCH1_9PEZI